MLLMGAVVAVRCGGNTGLNLCAQCYDEARQEEEHGKWTMHGKRDRHRPRGCQLKAYPGCLMSACPAVRPIRDAPSLAHPSTLGDNASPIRAFQLAASHSGPLESIARLPGPHCKVSPCAVRYACLACKDQSSTSMGLAPGCS